MLVKLVDLRILIVHMFIKFEDLFVLNSAVYVYTCAHTHNVCTYVCLHALIFTVDLQFYIPFSA